MMRGMQHPQRRSVEKLIDAVGRTFKAKAELDSKGRVVHLRNATLNTTLQPLWRDHDVFVRILKMSDATAEEGKGASVTAAFATDEEWLENMTPATVGEAVAVCDLTEKQLVAFGFEHAEGRWWTHEERVAEAARSSPSSGGSSQLSPVASGGLGEDASRLASAHGGSDTYSSVAARATRGSAAAPGAETPLAGTHAPRAHGDEGEAARREGQEALDLLRASATSLGLLMSDKALGKLARAGFDDGDGLLGLRLGGPAMYLEILEDLKDAPLNAAERVKLKAFMGVDLVEAAGGALTPPAARPPVTTPGRGKANTPLPMRVLDVLEVEDDDEDDDDDGLALEPAPPSAAPARTPTRGGRGGGTAVAAARGGVAAAAVAARTAVPAATAPPPAGRTNGSKVSELCALLDDVESAEFLSFAVESGALALRGRAAGVADRAKPAVVLEVWLARDLRLSRQECRDAARASVDEMCGWFVETLEERGGNGGNGVRDARVAGTAPEASSLAAMIAAGSSAGASDPMMLQAVQAAVLDPKVGAGLEEVRRLYSAGAPVRASEALARLGSSSYVAAMLYKPGDVKHVQGTSIIPGANSLVVLVGAVREMHEGDVAEWILPCLPPASDARAVARLMVRGELAKIDWESIFGSKTSSSLMPGAAKVARSRGGVDSTAKPSIVLMRGMALVMVGYPRAHPFDVGAAATLGRLLNEVARAMQDGLEQDAAIVCILDPIMQEVSRKWALVSQRSAAARPMFADVAEELKERRAFHVRQQLELSRQAPAPGGDEASKKGKHKEGEGDAMKKMAKQAEEAIAKVTAAAQRAAGAKPPGGGPSPRGGGGAVSEAAEWAKQEGNAGKCYFACVKGSCFKGEKCRFFADTPNHNK